MKIGIIGYGFVGGALKEVVKDSVDVLIVDPKLPESANILDLQDADIIFICVPTPTHSTDEKNPGIRNHTCDDSLVLDYVSKLSEYNGILVVKSTIPPHTVEEVLKVRPNTVIWPELLREKHAKDDMLYPRIVVIGTDNHDDFQTLEQFIENHTHIEWRADLDEEYSTKIRRASPLEASVFKYAVNTFLATKTLFMHQLYLWLERRGNGDSWRNITWLLEDEGRVGYSHLQAPGDHGLGYAGTCFPKDVKAFLEQVYHKDRTSFPLLNEVDIQNEQLRAPLL